MLNIIRADIYRLIRGKCIYITFIFFLVFISLQTALPGEITIGVSTDELKEAINIPGKINGQLAPFTIMSFSENIIFFMLAIIFVLTATDFSSGAVKNILSNGVSRIKLYASKLILASLFCIIMFTGGIITSVMVATIMNGFGGTITGEYLFHVWQPFALQLLILIASVSVGMAIIFITKKGSALNALYIAFFLVPTMIILLLMNIAPILENLMKYDLIINLKILPNIAAMANADIIRALLVGIVYITASTGLGMMIFKKSEIK